MNASVSAREATVLDIGLRLELFVDGYLIHRLEGARLKLHPPTPREVAISFDAPWEGPGSTYVTVMKDDDRYRAYYRGSGVGGQVTCYAESDDGITWTKPSLGVCEFKGSTDNNIVWTGFGTHNVMVFKDMNPDAAPEERYKALASGPPMRPFRRTVTLASPDGIHWRQTREEPILIQEATDWGADLIFWDAEQRQYVAYLRAWRTAASRQPIPIGETWQAAVKEAITEEGIVYRQVARSTSPDFVRWTEPEFIDLGDAPVEHFYTNATTPYFRAPHIYLAFPKRFLPERVVVPEHPQPGVSDGVFLSSRDGVHFDRTFMEAFLRPGRERQNWTHRNNMIAAGVLPTAADEVSIYWTEHYGHPTCRLRRGTLRLDGFVSVNAPYAGGELVTHPLCFEGRELVLNYATSAAGSVRVEIQDAGGQPLPGYSLTEGVELYGDEIERVASWEAGSDVGQLAGQPVRLRFVIKDADLYSIRFL